MDAVPDAECLGVVDVISNMTDAEVRALVDEVYASGMAQTLQDATRVLGKVGEEAEASSEPHQSVKTTSASCPPCSTRAPRT